MSLIISKFGTMQSSNIWLPDNCIHEYALENNANDTFGVHNGTPYNMSFSAGKIGQCGVFNGTNSYVDLGSPAEFNRTAKIAGGCAYECWFSSDVWGQTRYIIKDRYGWGIQLFTSSIGPDSGIRFTKITDSSTYNIDVDSLSLSTLYHAVVNIYTDFTCELFINGSSAGIITNTDSIKDNSAGLYIGAFNSEMQLWDGLIDIVRLYIGPLTQSQISTLYNAGAGRQYAAET